MSTLSGLLDSAALGSQLVLEPHRAAEPNRPFSVSSCSPKYLPSFQPLPSPAALPHHSSLPNWNWGILMRSSDLAELLHIARRGIPFTSTDGQAFVRLDEPSSGGFFILPVRSPAFRHWFISA